MTSIAMSLLVQRDRFLRCDVNHINKAICDTTVTLVVVFMLEPCQASNNIGWYSNALSYCNAALVSYVSNPKALLMLTIMYIDLIGLKYTMLTMMHNEIDKSSQWQNCVHPSDPLLRHRLAWH